MQRFLVLHDCQSLTETVAYVQIEHIRGISFIYDHISKSVKEYGIQYKDDSITEINIENPMELGLLHNDLSDMIAKYLIGGKSHDQTDNEDHARTLASFDLEGISLSGTSKTTSEAIQVLMEPTSLRMEDIYSIVISEKLNKIKICYHQGYLSVMDRNNQFFDQLKEYLDPRVVKSFKYNYLKQ